ncbi:MAG: aryl-sulfate sulfotransferase [Bacteroidia bacterium]|nr:aryl-sulfate sulfotransferase [Bacteroidia bacterium]
MKSISFFILVFCLSVINLFAQPTIGLIQNSGGTSDGYTLFSPTAYTQSYLIDNCGKLVHEWSGSHNTGLATYLSYNGNLIRTGLVPGSYYAVGGKGGAIEIIDWNDSIIWSYQYYAATYCLHHDICELPNGNILALAWERKTTTAATNSGRDPALLSGDLWSEKIIEIQPTFPSGGNIVWEWHLWDHLVQNYSSTKPNYGVIEDHPELLNLNYLGTGLNYTEWQHFNSIDYNAEHDQILISSRYMCEIYIIDHSTTTAEAAGHTGGVSGKGGDFLYRWGNPEAYNRGTVADRKLFDQHCAKWITDFLLDSNKIIIFNNGVNRPGGNISSVDIMLPPKDSLGNYFIDTSNTFGPDTTDWTYTSAGMYAVRVSGAQRLNNGNTLITLGPQADIFEIDNNKNKIWEYIGPVDNNGPADQGTNLISNSFFKALRYNPDFPGFTGHDLTPELPIEVNPLPYECSTTNIKIINNKENNISVFPNPGSDKIYIKGLVTSYSYKIYDITGKILITGNSNNEQNINISKLTDGIYFIKINSDNIVETFKIIKNGN